MRRLHPVWRYGVAQSYSGPAPGGGGGNEAETDTLIAAMSSAPDATREGHINTLIAALKSAGVWSKLDVLWILAAHDAQAARLNWKEPASFALTAVNSPTFTTDRGYATNANTAYLNTGWDAANNGSNFIQNDNQGGYWYETIGGAGAAHLGEYDGADGTLLGNSNFRNNCASITGATDNTVGMYAFQRTGASAQQKFKNGTGGTTGSQSSLARNSFDWFLGTCNNSGSPAFGSGTPRFAAAWAGASFSSGEHTSFYNAVRAYMTAVGVA